MLHAMAPLPATQQAKDLPSRPHPGTPNSARVSSWPLCRPAMAQLAEPGQRQRQASRRLPVATRGAYASVAWLFGAVGPAQPHQAVLAKPGVAVQASLECGSCGGG
jgi:hypothetical protein